MKKFTVFVYALFGTLALAAGLVAWVMPAVALPPGELTPLTAHLTRELSSAFVFIGLMFFWCIRHYEQRRPVHMAHVHAARHPLAHRRRKTVGTLRGTLSRVSRCHGWFPAENVEIGTGPVFQHLSQLQQMPKLRQMLKNGACPQIDISDSH